jgi:acyl-CoA thioesterase
MPTEEAVRGRLDRSFGAEATGMGEWRTRCDPGYEATNGMFGGWTAALLLSRIAADAPSSGSASALTVHYMAAVPPDREVVIRTHPRRAGRSLSFFQAELATAEQPDEVLALATCVLSNRRESDRFEEDRMPEAPAPDTLPIFHPPGGPFGERTEVRPVYGHPAFDQATTRSASWVRELSGRAVDAIQLTYLADVGAPRIFLRRAGPRPSSTITLSIYFHATEAELRDVGDDYVLTELTGTRAESSTFGSRGSLWSRAGRQLATMEQLCWFK